MQGAWPLPVTGRPGATGSRVCGGYGLPAFCLSSPGLWQQRDRWLHLVRLACEDRFASTRRRRRLRPWTRRCDADIRKCTLVETHPCKLKPISRRPSCSRCSSPLLPAEAAEKAAPMPLRQALRHRPPRCRHRPRPRHHLRLRHHRPRHLRHPPRRRLRRPRRRLHPRSRSPRIRAARSPAVQPL